MRKIRRLTNALSLLFATLLIAGPVTAQQVTGTLGSPTATTTLSGKQLPPPDPKPRPALTRCRPFSFADRQTASGTAYPGSERCSG